MLRFILGLLLAVSLQAGQSLRLNGIRGTYTSPNVANNSTAYIEFQYHTADGITAFVAPGGQRVLIDDNGIGLEVSHDTSNRLTINNKRDPQEGGSPCYLSLAGRSNVLVRAERNPTDLAVYCEMWDVDGTDYLYVRRTLLSIGNWTFSGGALSDTNTGGTNGLGFYRRFNADIALGSKPPTTAGGTGANTWLKLDGNPNDSSGNGNNMTISGAAYDATPGQDIIGVVIQVPGYKSWMGSDVAGVLRAERAKSADNPLTIPPNTFDMSKSYLMGDATDVPTCSVAYVTSQPMLPSEAPVTPTIGGSGCTRTVTNLISGAYEFDATVQGITTRVKVGAVAYGDDGVVIHPHPALNSLVGRVKVFGSSEWEWQDASRFNMFNAVANTYAIFGGTRRFDSLQPELMPVPPTGTAWMNTSDSYKVYGIGTNFCTHFCPGGASSCTGLTAANKYISLLRPHADPNVAPGSYPRQLNACVSNTELTLETNIDNPAYNVSSPGVAWTSVYNTPGANLGFYGTGCNVNENDNYYDNGLAHYSLWYRSGWWKARDAARLIADYYYRYPTVAWNACPRFMSLHSAMIRASADYEATMSYPNRWKFIDDTYMGRCEFSTPTSGRLMYVRESAYCMWYAADMARTDTDPTRVSSVKTKMVNWWNRSFKQTPTAEGAWLDDSWSNNVLTTTVFQVSQNSATVLRASGPAFPSDLCGVDYTKLGSISVAADRVTITGTGTNLVGSGGMQIYLRGTWNGVPWSMVSEIANSPVPTSTSAVLAYPWRGDQGSITSYKIISVAPLSRTGNVEGQWYLNFGRSDAAGNQPTPAAPDKSNWYWCNWVSGDEITLDKPYTGDTSAGNVYRKLNIHFPGYSANPFQLPLMAQALYSAHDGLKVSHPTEAAEIKVEADKLMNFITSVRNTTSGGAGYMVGGTGSHCDGFKIFPIYGCDHNGDANRDFALEMMGAYAMALQANNYDPAIKAAGDLYANDIYSRTGYQSVAPGLGVGAPGLIDAGSHLFKIYGQAFGVGRGEYYIAARLGQAVWWRKHSRLPFGRINFFGRIE